MSKNKDKTTDESPSAIENDAEEMEFEENNDGGQNDLLDPNFIDKTEDNKVPAKSSAKWSDYVMGQFADDELITDRNNKEKKYPNVGGLRRVARLLIGEIVESITEHRELNALFAIAESMVVIQDKVTGQILRFGDVGNCAVKDTKPPFDAHLPSIAATRAESRALRKALELKTLSAEEMSGSPTGSSDLTTESNLIETVQTIAIKKMCERNGLNYDRFIKYLCGVTPITEMTSDWAKQTLSDLHSHQAKKKEYPEELKNDC